MKLIIQKCFFVLFTLIKITFTKNLFSTNEDFIISISENFKKNFDTNEKLVKFKKNLVKKLRNRVKDNLRKNTLFTDLLEIQGRTISKNNNKIKTKKNKVQKIKQKSKKFEAKNSTAFFFNKKNNSKTNNSTEININNDINNDNKVKNISTENFNFVQTNNKNFTNNNTNEIRNINKTIIKSIKKVKKDSNNSKKNNEKEQNLNLINFHQNTKSAKSDLHNNINFPVAANLQNQKNKTSSKKKATRKKSSSTLDVFDWSFGDINSLKRVTKFYINLYSKCNIYINDTIFYDKDEYTSNFVDHLILHNNFDSIEPRSVFSNDVQINYFIYNKKLNMFTANFENDQHNNYSIVYEYIANNIIKMQTSKKENFSGNNNEKNVNEFLWKFYNENTNSKNLELEVEFYFTIDKNFMPENVEFNNKMFTYKTIIENKETLVFKWIGTLVPYEVKVFESIFPMVFENCEIMTVNFTMILIGAFFVIFVVLILYLLFSSIAKDIN